MNKIVEPDVSENEKSRYCKSCLKKSSYHTESGIKVCYSCGADMDKGLALAEPSHAVESTVEGLVGAKTGLPMLSLEEMKSNVERAKAEFEKIEIKLNKVRQAKLQAVEADDREKVVSLSKEDIDLSQKLDAAYELWQTAKKNYEGALIDKENVIVAEGLLADYNKLSVEVRAEKGNVFLNHVRQLNDLLSLIADMSAEFEGVQTKGMIDMEMLCRKLKDMNIYRIEDIDGNTIELPVIRNDNYGSIRPIREGLGREASLLETNLFLVERSITKIRKACNFHLLQRGD